VLRGTSASADTKRIVRSAYRLIMLNQKILQLLTRSLPAPWQFLDPMIFFSIFFFNFFFNFFFQFFSKEKFPPPSQLEIYDNSLNFVKENT
jgi:hypothetical protein